MSKISMMRIGGVFFLSFLFTLLPGVEHRAPQGYLGEELIIPAQKTLPLPPGLSCKLEVPSGPVMLGTGWMVHYVICNRNAEPFQIFYDSGFRSPRPGRTWLEAVDPTGHLAADPYADIQALCMGEAEGDPVLAPGAEHVFSINARIFVTLDRPGRWTIRVFHDLGYGPRRGDDDPRWASAPVDLMMPDAEQAKQVLAEHKSRTWENSDREGKRQEPMPDFAAMALPCLSASAGCRDFNGIAKRH